MLKWRPMHKIPASLLALLVLSTAGLSAQPAVARSGQADLAAYAAGSLVRLDGEWEFYWLRFVDPATIAGGAVAPDALGQFPGEWQDYRIPGAGATGYASYRLLVKGLDRNVDWGLKLSSLLSAGRLFANGALVLSYGRPGKDAASELPEWGSRVIRLQPNSKGELDLVIQMSNFADRAGGSRTPILFGDYERVAEARNSLRLFELFLFGAILVMGLYYLFLFGFRPADSSSLFFGLLCLSLALRSLCYDEYYILDLFPSMSWQWLYRLGYIMFPLPVACFAQFVRVLFPRWFRYPVIVVVLALSLVYAAIFAFAPTLVMGSLLGSYQLVTLATGSYIIYVLVRAVMAGEKGSLLLALGFVIVFAAAIHDILAANGVLKGAFLVQFGLLGFLFSMSLVITRKFAASFAHAESLSAELIRSNKAMKRFVPEEFLRRLDKSSIEQVALGDHAEHDMTVLFADIRRFSSIAEKLSPEDAFGFLNRYYARIGPVVRDFGGFIDKYMGDGIMALFPGSPEDAVRCAIEMQRRLAAYNVERATSGQDPIRVGIGINSGRLMLGTVGENERMDGTVISDAVNLASRLEGITKEFSVGVAVSERVRNGLADRSSYSTRFLGKVAMRGMREPMSVFEFYDGDEAADREIKDAIKGDFENALGRFYAQDYEKALALFKQVLEAAPQDEASSHYVRIIRKLSLA